MILHTTIMDETLDQWGLFNENNEIIACDMTKDDAVEIVLHYNSFVDLQKKIERLKKHISVIELGTKTLFEYSKRAKKQIADLTDKGEELCCDYAHLYQGKLDLTAKLDAVAKTGNAVIKKYHYTGDHDKKDCLLCDLKATIEAAKGVER